MPWSAGVYSRGYPSWTNDANNNLPISATKFDLEDNDFAAGINQCFNITGVNGPWARTSQEISLGITPSSYLFAPCDARRYGADPTGIADSTAAITNAIAVAASIAGTGPGGAAVTFGVGGYYLTSSSLTLDSYVQLLMNGSSINYSGVGSAITTATTGVTVYAKVEGGTISATSSTGTVMQLNACYKCAFRDLNFVTNSLTCTVIQLAATNTSGTTNPAGNYNCAENDFSNINQDTSAGGNGCGTFISFTGNDANHVSTLNTFKNLAANLVNVYGINFIQWCDSNAFIGDCRMNLNGAISPANAICVGLGTGAGGGVYAESFQFLAGDCFANPAVDNRTGFLANNTTVKFIVCGLFEWGPAAGSINNALAPANITQMLSYDINQAPRAATNYISRHMVGTNLGVGVAANPAATVIAGNVGQTSGATQYGYYSQTPGFNSGAPSLVAGYGSQPSLASSAGAYTVAQVMAYYAAAAALGANAAATNVYSFYDSGQTVGSAKNYGFYSAANVNGVINWAFYGAGTAPSLFGGQVSMNANQAVPAGGSTLIGLLMTSAATLGIFVGSGAPTLSAAQGSLYIRTDGSSTSTRLYVAANSAGTWTNVVTAA